MKNLLIGISIVILLGSCIEKSHQERTALYDQHIMKSNVLIKKQNYKKAIIELNEAIKIFDTKADAILLKGDCYHFMKEYDKAEDEYSTVIDMNVQLASALKRRAINYLEQNDNDFIDDIDEYLSYRPNDKEVKLLKLNYYIKNEEYEKAISMYSDTLISLPNSEKLFTERCGLHIKNNDYKKALNDCKSALDLNPNSQNLILKKNELSAIIKWKAENKLFLFKLAIVYLAYVFLSFLIIRPFVVKKAKATIGGVFKIALDPFIWLTPIILFLFYIIFYLNNAVTI